MRVAYVTRAQRGLQGGAIIARNFLRLGLGIEVVEVPREVPGAQSYRYPEYLDLLSFKYLDRVEWSNYDRILYGEQCYAPFFYLAGLEATWVCHFLWLAPDDTASVLEHLLPFVTSAIAPTPFVLGALLARGVAAKYAPYPVPSAEFLPRVPWEEKKSRVVWVGRDDELKNLVAVAFLAGWVPEIPILVVASTPTTLPLPPHVELIVEGTREQCVEAIRNSRVLLSTALYETFATAVIEGGMAGCNVLVPNRPGHHHVLPAATLYSTLIDAMEVLPSLLATPPRLTEFWSRYDVEAVRPLWSDAIGVL